MFAFFVMLLIIWISISHKERGFSPEQAVKLLANQFDAFETCF